MRRCFPERESFCAVEIDKENMIWTPYRIISASPHLLKVWDLLNKTCGGVKPISAPPQLHISDW